MFKYNTEKKPVATEKSILVPEPWLEEKNTKVSINTVWSIPKPQVRTPAESDDVEANENNCSQCCTLF